MIKKRIMAAVIALLLIVNVSPMSLVAYAESDMGTEEVTLSASPDTLTCIITFDMCGHGESIEAVEAEAGACIDKPNDPEAEGFIFDGWYVDKEYTTAWVFETNAVIGDTVLYARWIAEEQIQVSLDTQLFAQYTGERQESLTELTPEPTLESTPEPTPESTPELTPEPSPIIIYTVTFNLLGHGTVIESIAVEAGTLLTKPDDPSEAGFDFEGWYADQEHTSIWNFETDTVNENITLFAKWSEAEQASEDSSAEQETAEAACPAFGQSRTVNGVTVHVSAPEGVFPMNASLSVELVPVEAQPQVDAAVETERESGRNVAVSYTFDIKVLDPEGNELQPGEGQSVNVSFTLTEVANENLTTEVYHVSESEEGGSLSAEVMKVETNEATATVTTEGFSFYTVEFTYGEKQYVLEGGVEVFLSDILRALELSGVASAVEVSNTELIYAWPEGEDDWLIIGTQAFTTKEWMKVTIDDIEYTVTLTDEIIQPAGSGLDDFAADAPITTITIDKSKFDAWTIDSSGPFTRIGTDVRANSVNFTPGSSTQVGAITIRIPDAAVYSDGVTRADILLTFDVTVFPSTTYNSTITRNIQVLKPNHSEGFAISAANLTVNQAGQAGGQTNNVRSGFLYDMTISLDGGSGGTLPGTYLYSAYGFNRSNGNWNNSVVLEAARFYNWGESHTFLGGDVYLSSELRANNGGGVIYGDPGCDGGFYNGTSNDVSYLSGFATVLDQNAASAQITSFGAAGGSQTTSYLLTDKLTHNYTSSSDYYGKIELWTNGMLDGAADRRGKTGDPLYGGRYVNGQVDQKRTYDVPYGKDVTYKMTPESGYIIHELYIDGQRINKNSPEYANFTTVYDASGAVEYYTYKFDGDMQAGDLNDPTFDPRSAKGGSAHTIHVTWQPMVDLDFYKKWDDAADELKLRPTSLGIELQQNGVNYQTVYTTSPELYYDTAHIDPSVATIPCTMTSADAIDQTTWQYQWAAGGKSGTMFRNLPMYDHYGQSGQSLHIYTVEETLTGAAAAYYNQIRPHVVVKTDTPLPVSYHADGTSFYFGFDESQDAFVQNGGLSRELDYTIVNRLYTGGLAIEKDSVPDDDGSFAFTVTLNHPYADFSQLGFSGTVGGDWTKTVSAVAGDSIHRISGLPAGTTYSVTETVPDGWKLLGSSGASGEILAGDFWAYDVGGTLFIKDGAGYVNTSGQQIPLPTATDPPPLLAPYYGTGLGAAAGTYAFDKIGAEIVRGSAGYAYRYGDGGSVPRETLPGWDVSYTKQSAADGQYVIYRSNNANADDTVIGTAVDRACFQNIKTVDLSVKKIVDGNQASKDKFFKFTLELTTDPNSVIYSRNMDFKDDTAPLASGADVILQSWIAELDMQYASLTPQGNAATMYAAAVMGAADANSRDDEPTEPGQQIKIVNGQATVTVYLQHGQQFTLKGLPYGVSYTVTEEAEDYRPETEILSGDKKTNESGSGGGEDIMIGHQNRVKDTSMLTDTALQFTNIRGGITPTGLADSIRPALFGLGLAGALMLVLLLPKAGRRRGKHEHA